MRWIPSRSRACVTKPASAGHPTPTPRAMSLVSRSPANPARARLGAGAPPELIAVTTPAHAPLVLVEGHVRLTACALFPEYLPPVTEILLGISEEMTRWWAF